MAHKYKVGDRVRYLVKDIGNIDLHGWIGTVVGIDNDHVAPYTVRFDDDLCTLVTDERYWKPGQPTHRDYWCREENLVPAVLCPKTTEAYVREPDETEKKRRKPMKKRTSIYDVPDDVRQRIRTMVEEGMSVGKIAEVMDIEYGKMKNMLSYFRRRDPSFPRSTHTWGETHPEDAEPAPQDATDYKARYEEARALIEKMDREIADLNNANADLHAALEKADESCAEYLCVIESLQNAMVERQEVVVALKEDKQSMTDMVVGLVRKFVLSGEEVSV